jgi:hypothetical protein
MRRMFQTDGMVSFLMALRSYRKFKKEMLPPEISHENVISALEFISPQLILIHGSYVAKTRYSPRDKGDLDLVVISIKTAFWPVVVLRDEIVRKLKRVSKSIEFDISLTTPRGLLAHLKERTALGQSLLQGFTILHYHANGGKTSGN